MIREGVIYLFCWLLSLLQIIPLFVYNKYGAMATAAGSTGSDNAHVIESGALVCESVTLAGSYRVVIGAGTIVQPNVVIVAQDGPIIIGEKNIVREDVVILNAKEEGQGEGATKELRIGKMNLFCTGVRIEQCTIGNINIFEPKSIVRQGCTVGNAAAGAHCRTLCGRASRRRARARSIGAPNGQDEVSCSW